MSLCPLLSSTVCPLPVSTLHYTVCSICVTMSTAVFCQYIKMRRRLDLFHCVHCRLLQSMHSLSVPQGVPSVGSVSLCLMLTSRVFTISQITPYCTVLCSVSLCPLLTSKVVHTHCQIRTLYILLDLGHCVH